MAVRRSPMVRARAGVKGVGGFHAPWETPKFDDLGPEEYKYSGTQHGVPVFAHRGRTIRREGEGGSLDQSKPGMDLKQACRKMWDSTVLNTVRITLGSMHQCSDKCLELRTWRNVTVSYMPWRRQAPLENLEVITFLGRHYGYNWPSSTAALGLIPVSCQGYILLATSSLHAATASGRETLCTEVLVVCAPHIHRVHFVT